MTKSDPPSQRQREQLLKLVAKAFYRELTNYGVGQNEMLSVANHLLDRLVQDSAGPQPQGGRFDSSLKIERVSGDWSTEHRLVLDDVSLRPLEPGQLPTVAEWLREQWIRESFVPALPEDPSEVRRYFEAPDRDYLAIFHGDDFVGVIGAESTDPDREKLEMKKLVGVREARGIGVGTKATFTFLYYAFMVREAHKVYTYTLDTNVKNLNLNSHLGFEVEGILLEEMKHDERHLDVLRMALLKPIWLELFRGTE